MEVTSITKRQKSSSSKFKSGVETTEDEARPGCPFSVRNEGLIAKVRKRIQEERCDCENDG